MATDHNTALAPISQRTMKNRYEIRGDETVIYLKRRDGTEIPALIDTEDFERVRAIGTWVPSEVRHSGEFYVIHNEFKAGRRLCCTLLHRVIINAPSRALVDHINHDRLDNRKANLRLASRSLNAINRAKNERGVHLIGGRWVAVIFVKGTSINLGTFLSERDARLAFAGALVASEKLLERSALVA